MFTNPLPDNDDYRVVISEYAQRHFIRRFAKDYKGKRWILTERSIVAQLDRIKGIEDTSKVDELKKGDGCILFKYDFAVAQSGVSPKASVNRCIIFLDTIRHRQDVLMVYGKGDLPKNTKETQYIYQTVKEQFSDMWRRLD
jgi:hypothetical protein